MKTKCEQLFLIENVKHVADVGDVGDVERVGQLVKLPAKWRPTVAHAQTCTDMCELVPSVYRERERKRKREAEGDERDAERCVMLGENRGKLMQSCAALEGHFVGGSGTDAPWAEMR